MSSAAPRRRLSPTLVFSAAILIAFALIAVVSLFALPQDPFDFVSDEPFSPPVAGIWLGADYLGRDVLSRLMDGTRITLFMALSATLLAHLIGDTLGLLAATRGGFVDAVLSRIVDVVLALPKIIVGLVVVAALGSSVSVIIGIAAVVYSAGVFRIARALGNDLKEMDYIKLARSRGEGMAWILFGEMLPHVVKPLATDFAIRASFAILFMSSLSFVGLGVQPPMADWGGMARENLGGLSTNPLAAVGPAVAIALVSIALNMLVDALDGDARH
ncbi:ABC transporter permease [Bosea sp. (in: a-proteobacteria)]|jgi:peptide/nickel transport system permease protein|uniref:ABC transporter permease n=1 Tax=Bosea sp. (in: a-proteobacteria) TaxID=1871050 RepID=UPI00356AFB67